MKRCNAVWVLLSFGLLLVAGGVRAEGCFNAPYKCVPQGDIDPATPTSYAAQYQAYANFAWQDFLALNFPAKKDDQGQPLPEPSIVDGLGFNGGDYTAVWQVWAGARDLFLPDATAPERFGSGHETPKACTANGAGRLPVLRRVGSAAYGSQMVLDEYVQANRMGPVIDRNGQYIRYGINFNKVIYDYIVDHRLYSREGQLTHDAANPDRDKDTVRFPAGSYDSGSEKSPGSIFVKSSWKMLGPGDSATAFYRTSAYVYEKSGGAFDDEPTVTERCEVKTVGLVGLHIVHLSDSAPQWVWATFEHVSNAPWLADFASHPHSARAAGPYSFYDVETCPPVAGMPGCPFNTIPPLPWNPQVTKQPASQLVRVAAPGELAIAANKAYRQQLEAAYPGSVWANYFLVDVQFPTVVKKLNDGTGKANVNLAYPDGVPSASHLANSTMETFIQGFHSQQKTSNGNGIPAIDQMQNNFIGIGPPVDPFEARVFNRAGGAERVTSSCIGCHADATMTTGSSSHLLFSLNRAQWTVLPLVKKKK